VRAALPRWAMDRAHELARAEQVDAGYFEALTRYIAAHEEPPVDPLLVEAREIALKFALPGRMHGIASAFVRKGAADDTDSVKAVLAALNRGIELAKSGGA
jgi:hypothetical protein